MKRQRYGRIVNLASVSAAFINGATLDVNGGQVMV
jgi:NAD(P)-dependent dehydrogenase (short-subunit alcohol dehydrogenase family)